ncbi:ATP-binding protein [Nonomuraea sp. NPDC005983]|uniref:ATP-binding protein n=1 Tax=Nonomuraea sp. NPDC005983 TaxID=3155595 RepID=UPI0033A9EE15
MTTEPLPARQKQHLDLVRYAWSRCVAPVGEDGVVFRVAGWRHVGRGAGHAALGGVAVDERFLGEIVLPGVAHSVAVARRCLGEILTASGHRDVDDARLVVSELVSNALVHTASGLRGGVVVVEVIAVDAVTVRVEVADDGADTVPRPREFGDGDCHGRGLWLVEQVAAKWGVRRLGGRRRAVWAVLTTGQHAPAGAC